jgi:hypothetical protein
MEQVAKRARTIDWFLKNFIMPNGTRVMKGRDKPLIQEVEVVKE